MEADRRSTSARKCVGSERARFTVLIGSRARRTQNSSSDIDIVRIGHKEPAKLKKRPPKQSFSYVDYKTKTFSDLYDRGSLFLYHVFKEGRLLEGSPTAWNCLKENFRVCTNFEQEISQNRKFLKWLQAGEKFKGAIIPYLAHTCRALKNLAIFSLAQKRRYVFDKGAALRKAFPQLSDEAIDLLITANNAFERSPQRPLSGDAVGLDAISRLRKQVALAVKSPH